MPLLEEILRRGILHTIERHVGIGRRISPWRYWRIQNRIVDRSLYGGYPPPKRSGGSGAAKPSQPRQVRKEAAVRSLLWVPPGCRPERLLYPHGLTSKQLKSLPWIEQLCTLSPCTNLWFPG